LKAVCRVALLCCYAAATSNAQSAPLKLKQTIPLPGVEGRIDHFAVDPSGQRLFVCALGNNSLEVIDLRNGERVHSITGLGAPQGVGYAAEVSRLFVANDEGGICKIYDGKSFQTVGELNLKDDADNVRYDGARKKFYVGFGSGGIAVINTADGKQVGFIKVGAHPEAFQLEKNGNRIFVNVPNSRHVAVIDRDKGETKRHCIYVICGAGKIDVIEQVDPNAYKPSTKIDTAEGARTGLFVSERATLFVAVPHRGSQRAEIRCYAVE
jgi:DNA-binding beta-propeller fold protein YncE